jgi:DNA-binding PadR family transcriptional regulator
MDNVVLGLLIIQSLTLYELKQTFSQGISMFYSASYGSLQVAVRNLLARGMITYEERVEKGRHKKIYHITEQGCDAFFAWMLADIPASKLEVTALSKVYFLGLMPGIEQRREIVLDILCKIEQVQSDLMTMNAEFSRIEVPAEYQEILKYQLATLDYGIQAHHCGRAWFQGLLQELEELGEG